jgi:hypothetical protein
MSSHVQQEIAKTTTELADLEKQRNKQRADMETLGLFSWPALAANRQKYPERKVEIARQKLMSLQLASINEVSERLNQNVQTLNESTKSLEKTTMKVVMSSTRIEYLTMLVALSTVANTAIVLLTINFYYSIIISVGGSIALVRLWQKISKHPAFKTEEAKNKSE